MYYVQMFAGVVIEKKRNNRYKDVKFFIQSRNTDERDVAYI